jgi:uncharacterized membrane protein
MASSTMSGRATGRTRPIKIRKISTEDLRDSLRDGWRDFMSLRGDIFIAGFVYTFIGVAAVVVAMNGRLLPFLFPVLAGVGPLGPIAATGFYELARRRENGQNVHWFDFLEVRKRSTVDEMGIVAGVLLAIFFVWLLVAGALYAILFNWAVPESIPQFVDMVFNTQRGWMLIGAGVVAGAILGWLVLALSIVSLPMLVDADVSAADALATSWRAAHANMGEMIRWGFIVTILLVLGSIPLFVGLAFVLPWLGYSTWHLYTRLVDRDSIPAKRRRRD